MRGFPTGSRAKFLASSTAFAAMLSWTINRRSVVQRCPQVPAAANTIARKANSRLARRRDDHAVIAAELEQRPSQPSRDGFGATARPIRTEPVAEINGSFSLAANGSAEVGGIADNHASSPAGFRHLGQSFLPAIAGRRLPRAGLFPRVSKRPDHRRPGPASRSRPKPRPEN